MTGNLFEALEPSAAKATGEWLTAHCDGGSAATPAPPATARSLKTPTAMFLAQLSEFLGIQTNNYAEYSGLLAVAGLGR